MDTLPSSEHPSVPRHDARARLAAEAEAVAAARAELDAGHYVDAEDVEAWVASLSSDVPRPPPAVRRR